MIIVRAPRRTQFEVIPHALLMDDRVSFRARGIAVRLLANMDGYKMSSLDLAKQTPNEGRYAVLSALRELRDAGYITWERRQGARGRWTTIVTISDTPAPLPTTEVRPLHSGTQSNQGSGMQSLHSGECAEVELPDSGRRTFGAPYSGQAPCKSTNTKTSTKSTTTDNPDSHKLLMPVQLTTEQRVLVTKVLSGLTEPTQQQLLDELTGALASSNPPRKPFSWLRAIAERARRGEYVPELALGVAADRTRRAAETKDAQYRRESAASAELRRRDPLIHARALEAMREAKALLGVVRD